MEQQLISVIIPAYNAEKTVSAAVRSALDQTWKSLEVIVVDDGSRDRTAELVREIASGDERVRLFCNEENRGVSYNRNLGVREAKGEWVAFLDSDDLWTSDKLEKQMETAKKHPEAGLFFTGSAFIDAEDRRNTYVLRVPEKVNYSRLLGQNVISCSSVLAKRTLMLAHPMGNDAIHEDFAVWLSVLREEPYAYAVDEPLLIYRVSRTSKSGNKRKAAQMTFATYRASGVPLPRILWSGTLYTLRGIRKFRSIAASWTDERYGSGK